MSYIQNLNNLQSIEQLSRTEQREDDRLKFREMAEWHRSQLKELVVHVIHNLLSF